MLNRVYRVVGIEAGSHAEKLEKVSWNLESFCQTVLNIQLNLRPATGQMRPVQIDDKPLIGATRIYQAEEVNQFQ